MMKKMMRVLAAGLIGTGLLLSTASFQPSAEAANVTFKDTIPAWAKSSVEQAVSLGILGGYPDGTFKPNSPISRAELLKVMALTFDLKVNPASSGAWYLPYKQALIDAQIYMANDYPGNLNNSATRNEMAKMAVRGAIKDYRGKQLSASELMFRAVHAGLLGRTGTKAETIDAAGTTTRAQAAVLITRILQLKNGGSLPVDKGASSAAEIAWHRHNMITMFNQNDLKTLPYKVKINDKFQSTILQLIVLDPSDKTGYYNEYLQGAKYILNGNEPAGINDGYVFAYKVMVENLKTIPGYTQSATGGFYMYISDGSAGGAEIADKFNYFDKNVSDHSGLYVNRYEVDFGKPNNRGYDFNVTYVSRDFIQSQIKRHGALPIHLERYGAGYDDDSGFYLTEVEGV